MARRKKTIDTVDAATAETQQPPTAPAEAPEPTEFMPPSLTPLERLKLKLAESEMQRYVAEGKLHEVHRTLLLKRIDPQGQLQKLDKALQTATTSALRAKKAYSDAVVEVETRLNVKLADYAFDDETGTLIPH